MRSPWTHAVLVAVGLVFALPEASAALCAYVANENSNNVIPIAVASNTTGTAIGVGSHPIGIAVTPDGNTAYVTNLLDNTVTPIDLTTGVAGTPINVLGNGPVAIAITPNGLKAYVANQFSANVTPIILATQTALSPITVGSTPTGIAITPDGATAYVTLGGADSVNTITLASGLAGTPIPVGQSPAAVAITPDGVTAYVANQVGNSVTPITIATNMPGTTITGVTNAAAIAITPDGSTAYVANGSVDTVTPINLASNIPGSAISVSATPLGIAITPDGLTAYVTHYNSGNVIPIDIASNIAGSPIGVGTNPQGIAMGNCAGPTSANCVWNPSGLGPDNWTNPNKWTSCSTGAGPGPGPAGTPGAADFAQIGSGTVNLDVPVTVAGLTLNGGVLQGANSITVVSDLTWNGGELRAPNSGFELNVGGSATATLAGGQKTLNGRKLTLANSLTSWTTGLIDLGNGAVIEIGAGSTLQATPGAAEERIYFNGAGAEPQINNLGSIVKTGAFVAGIDTGINLSSSGALQVQGGKFKMRNRGTGSGSFDIASGAALELSANTFDFLGAATVTGSGELQFGDLGATAGTYGVAACLGTNGPVTLRNAALTVGCSTPQVFHELKLEHPLALLQGSANMVVSFDMQWMNGTIRGNGAPSATLTLNAAATALWPNPGLPGDRVLDARDFINLGVVSVTGFTNTTVLANNARVVNTSGAAVVLSQNSGSGTALWQPFGSGTPQFLNQGLLDTQLGGWSFGTVFTNDGSVNVAAGAGLSLQNAGTDTGTYSVGASAGLSVIGPLAIRTVGGSGGISGAGVVGVDGGGQLTVTAPTYTINQTLINAAAGTTLNLSTGGTVTVPELALQGVGVGGTLTGTSPIVTTVQFRHERGLVTATSGTPSLTIASGGGSFPSLDTKTWRQRALVIDADSSWTGGDIALESGATIAIQPGRTLNVNFAGTNGAVTCIATCSSSFSNNGTLTKSNAGTLTLASALSFNQAGILNVNGGTFAVPAGFTQTAGTTTVGFSSILDLASASLTLGGGVLSGSGQVSGNVNVTGGTVQPGITPLTITGNYVQGAAGSLQIRTYNGATAPRKAAQIAAPANLPPGVLVTDRLSIGGSATLAGSLTIVDTGYTPVPPDKGIFLTAASVSGSFAPVSNPFAFYGLLYGASNVALAPLADPVVNSDLDPGDGVCDASECTLREAIDVANQTPALDQISFDSLVFAVPRTIVLSAGVLTPAEDLSIAGPGAGLLTVSGNSITRVLEFSSVNLTIDGLTLSAGNGIGSLSSGNGGAIYQDGGTLNLSHSVLSGNACGATGTGGALVSSVGNLSLVRTSVTANVCNNAGAIYVQDGSATLLDSTLSGNSGDAGEALRLSANGVDSALDLTNVTISGNSTVNGNSAIRSESTSGRTATIVLTNSTISGNTTSGLAGNGAIWQNPLGGIHITRLHNSIVAGNTVAGVPRDVEGSLDPASSFNVIGSGGGLSNGLNGNQVGVTAPLLAPLGNYGGPTATQALLPGSPAINAGSNALAPPFDQRGIARPQLTTVDVGAFESRGFVLSLISGTPQSAPPNQAFAAPLVVGVAANAGTEPVDGGQVLFTAPASGASATLVTNPAIVASGQASVVATANGTPGTYSVTATANGGSGTTSFALTNLILATTTAISTVAPTTSVVGQPYTVTVAVTEGSNPVTTGTVTVTQLNDGTTCTINLVSATSCQLVATSALTTTLRASYGGAAGFATSVSANVAHVVDRADTAVQILSDTPDPSAPGQSISVSVSLGVLAPGAGTPSGDVLITDGSASCSFTLPQLSCALIPKALGATTLEARYLGDANFNASTDTEAHTISADGADLSILLRNGLRLLPGGGTATYVLLVNNAGPQDVVNARVSAILPPQLSNANWTCVASVGASCPAAGAGTLDALVSMASGASVTFNLSVAVQANPEQLVSNRATVTAPANAPDPNLSNNESTDTDPIGVFGEGLETESE